MSERLNAKKAAAYVFEELYGVGRKMGLGKGRWPARRTLSRLLVVMAQRFFTLSHSQPLGVEVACSWARSRLGRSNRRRVAGLSTNDSEVCRISLVASARGGSPKSWPSRRPFLAPVPSPRPKPTPGIPPGYGTLWSSGRGDF